MMTAFEDLPDGFDKMLGDINKAYPPATFLTKNDSTSSQLTKAKP
jgi:hypothetical protein